MITFKEVKEMFKKSIDATDTMNQALENLIQSIYLKGYNEALEQEPCEDAISRQAVDEIKELMTDINGDTVYAARMSDIRQLPPVTPQPKMGRWIEVIDEIDSLGNKTWHHKCSMCGNEDSGFGDYKYCPKCGARMLPTV